MNGCFFRVQHPATLHSWIAIVALTLIPVLGCSKGSGEKKRVPVKGTVLFRDKPLAKARVTFYSKGAQINPSAETNDQGQFDLGEKGAIPGPNTVTVVLPTSTGAPNVMDPAAMTKGGAGGPLSADAPGTGGTPGSADMIPKIYGDAVSSPLQFTISDKGEADLKVEVK